MASRVVALSAGSRRRPLAGRRFAGSGRAQNAQLLDLFGEDSWRRVYAGELEVRPPGAPTSGRMSSRPWVNPWRLIVTYSMCHLFHRLQRMSTQTRKPGTFRTEAPREGAGVRLGHEDRTTNLKRVGTSFTLISSSRCQRSPAARRQSLNANPNVSEISSRRSYLTRLEKRAPNLTRFSLPG